MGVPSLETSCCTLGVVTEENAAAMFMSGKTDGTGQWGGAAVHSQGTPASPGQYRPPLLVLLFTADVPAPSPTLRHSICNLCRCCTLLRELESNQNGNSEAGS